HLRPQVGEVHAHAAAGEQLSAWAARREIHGGRADGQRLGQVLDAARGQRAVGADGVGRDSGTAGLVEEGVLPPVALWLGLLDDGVRSIRRNPTTGDTPARRAGDRDEGVVILLRRHERSGQGSFVAQAFGNRRDSGAGVDEGGAYGNLPGARI